MALETNQNPPPDWPIRFLDAYRKIANVTLAAERAGVSRRAVYKRGEADPEFAGAMEDAREEAYDRLEHEAFRRGARGVLEPVFYQGERCGEIRRYSDALLALLLKANRPERFRENARIEHAGQVGVVPVREIVIEVPKDATDSGAEPV
jgi:hypothetical protein